MPQITDIRAQKTRKDRVNVFIDGRYAFALDQISAYEARLEVGQDVSDERLGELVDKAGLDSAMSVALRYLTSRPGVSANCVTGSAVDRLVRRL